MISKSSSAGRILVIGAGVFGAWTARRLQEMNYQVRLVDAWDPAHSRASSGGESRMIRGAYGGDRLYSRMAIESLPEWKDLSSRSRLPLFHETGVLFFFTASGPYVENSIEALRRIELPIQVLDRAAMSARFPMIDFTGIEVGLYEPQFGALMARRSVQELVGDFVKAGGVYEKAFITPPAPAAAERLDHVLTKDGRRLEADHFVFACGAWFPQLFPDLLGSRILPTRQEVFFFAPPDGDDRFEPGLLPGWADYDDPIGFYGFPNLEGRGFKIAHDLRGPRMNIDTDDRIPSPERIEQVRSFLSRRFPAMAKRPLIESRVCQYENSSNGDFLIDFHPGMKNVLLVGGGSGHGFKHGPAVGRYAADLLGGRLREVEPRFSLASKK